MENILPSYIDEYLDSLLPERNAFLASLEKEAADTETYAPIIDPVTAGLLRTMVRLVKPKRILELGTAIGYSSIVMAEEMDEGGEIITVERYTVAANRARDNILKAGYGDVIKIVNEEAENALAWLDGPFDMIFMDAAKGQYMAFLPDCMRLLKNGGLLISDDVLYKGEVTSGVDVEKRKVTLVKRMNGYLEYISDCKCLKTTVLPIGNGIALSVKLAEYGEEQHEKD